jgi:N-acetylneuraminate synthase/N,N'-diacetyllegionaminate synthase
MMKKTFVIAEAGVNHNGSLDTAKKLVDMASECGADAVKFQTFKGYECAGEFADKAQYQKENMQSDESQLKMLNNLEMPFECFSKIKEHCSRKGIVFISTPDGIESLSFLLAIDVPSIKIASTEVTNPEFLREIGKTGKPIILSTGMSTLGEIEKALESIYATGNRNVKLLHCTTDYPTRLEDVNLKAMVTMKEAFKIPVGFSDHSLGFEAAIAAVAMGAEIIEKHITLDKNMEGPDHKASMSPKEFKEYVASIRNTEKLLGDGIKRPSEREKVIMRDVRRSIVAGRNLEKNTILEEHMLAYKRPALGISPEFSYVIVGRKIKRNMLKDEPITWKDI